LPKPESEKHWYNHIGIGGGGDTVKTRLAISVLDDGGGSSRIHVAGNPGDKAAAAASESVIESLHDKIAGATLVATTAPAAPAVASPVPPAPVSAPPAAAPPVMASAPPQAAASSAPPPIAGVSTGSTDLHVADTVPNTWTRVGLALERAQLGALSGRDEKAHTYTLDFSATLTTNAEGEHHWYTRVLHPFGGGDYYLGAFLLGAYQEILGDLHNLFGDTNAVHVRLGPTGEVMLDSVIKGDTVREVLNYVQFSADGLVMQLRRDVEAALREGRLTYEESGALLRFYEEGLHGYTYLEDVHDK